MEPEIFMTENLLLKKLTPEALNYIFQNFTEVEIKEQLGLTTQAEYERERAKYEGGYSTYNRSIVLFQILLKETNEIIGSCGYHNWYSDHRKAELGYSLLNDTHKKKGYMTEAINTALAYGFDQMNLNRVEACIGPENIASLSLVKKYGFVREGYLRQHHVHEGVVYDSIIFSLLREEYELLKGN